MSTQIRFAFALTITMVAAVATHGATYNEAVNGDLSGNRSAPTPFSLAAGSNDLLATTQSGDLDIVTVNVPTGSVLNQLFLRSFTRADFDTTAFIGVQSGTTFTVDPNIDGAEHLLGWAHFGEGSLNMDLLPSIGAGFDAIGFTPPLAPGPYSLFLQQLGTAVTYDLDFVVTPNPAVWNVDADGDWSVAANWSSGEPNGVSASARFLGAISAPRTVSVDVAKTVGTLTFDNAHSYTLGGPGTLTLDNAGAVSIEVISGSHAISAPLSFAAGNTVTKSGQGTLTISGPQSHAAGAILITIGGVTNLNSDGGANFSVQARARVNLGSTQHLGSLLVGTGATTQLSPGGNNTLVTPRLFIASTAGGPVGKFDLADNSAIINYSGVDPTGTLRQQIVSGRGGSGLGKPWNGLGITSSTAQADVAASPNSRSVGYANNGELPLGAYTNFKGEPVDATSVLLRYTRTGDANLDGVVNDDDVTVVGTFYAPGVSKPDWAKGDFDYNGFVDDDDVTLLGVFYNPLATPIPATTAEAGSEVAAVPEPATITLLWSTLLLSLASD